MPNQIDMVDLRRGLNIGETFRTHPVLASPAHISCLREYTLYLTIDNRVLFSGQLNSGSLSLYELWPNLRKYNGELSLATPIYATNTIKLGGVGLMIDLVSLFASCETIESVREEMRSILNYQVRRGDGSTHHPNQKMDGWRCPYTIMYVLGIAKARVEPSLPEELEPIPIDRDNFRLREGGTAPCHLVSSDGRLMMVFQSAADHNIMGYYTSGTYAFTVSPRTSRGIANIQPEPKPEDFDKILYNRDGVFVEELWMATGPHTPQKVYYDIASRCYTDSSNGYKLIWKEHVGYVIQRIGLGEDGDKLWEPMPLP